MTYDWAESEVAFIMAAKHKTSYLHELHHPRLEAKLLAKRLREDDKQATQALQNLLNRIGMEVEK